jgi:hypothetical protein
MPVEWERIRTGSSFRLGGADGQAAGRGEPRHLTAARFRPTWLAS